MRKRKGEREKGRRSACRPPAPRRPPAGVSAGARPPHGARGGAADPPPASHLTQPSGCRCRSPCTGGGEATEPVSSGHSGRLGRANPWASVPASQEPHPPCPHWSLGDSAQSGRAFGTRGLPHGAQASGSPASLPGPGFPARQPLLKPAVEVSCRKASLVLSRHPHGERGCPPCLPSQPPPSPPPGTFHPREKHLTKTTNVNSARVTKTTFSAHRWLGERTGRLEGRPPPTPTTAGSPPPPGEARGLCRAVSLGLWAALPSGTGCRP